MTDTKGIIDRWASEPIRNNIWEEEGDDRKLTRLSDENLMNIKFVMLPLWVEMRTNMRIGQWQKLQYSSLITRYFGVHLEFRYFDWNENPAILMDFEEFVGWHLVFFAEKNGFKIID